MTGKGGDYHIFLPLIFPTIVVVVLALGVLLLVRTLFDGAAWRIDRLVFRFERIDPKVGLQRIVSNTTVVRVLLSFIGFAVLVSAAWLLAGPLIVVLGDLPASLGRGAGQGDHPMKGRRGVLELKWSTGMGDVCTARLCGGSSTCRLL